MSEIARRTSLLRTLRRGAQQKECPAEAGLDRGELVVADHPAVSIWAADLMRPSASAWSYGSHNYRGPAIVRSAPVATTIVAVATAAAIGTAMKADATTASDLNNQTILSSMAKRHGFGGNC